MVWRREVEIRWESAGEAESEAERWGESGALLAFRATAFAF